MKKILIFAPQRTGSTTLKRLVEYYTRFVYMPNEIIERNRDEVNLFDENGNMRVFSKINDGSVNYINEIEKSYSKFIPLTEKRYIGIKHEMWWTNESITKEVFNLHDKIIFLFRKNLFKSILSLKIAEKLNTWRLYNNELDRNSIHVDVNEFKEKIEHDRSRINFYSEYLNSSNHDHIIITFEELFGGSLQDKCEASEEIYKFIDCKTPPQSFLEDHLSSSKKITNQSHIDKIQNYKYLLEKFGNERINL